MTTAIEVNDGPAPVYVDASTVPLILAQRRLTNIRRKQLLKAASRAYDDPPPPPKPDECCGSSCDPCVKTLWKEALACWKQRWGDGACLSPKPATAASKIVAAPTTTMPGSFDW